MKKFVLSICAVLFISGFASAQISIDSTDMPVPGDIIRNSIFSGLDSLYGADYLATGANHTWNFAQLGWFKQKVDTFMNVDETLFASHYAGIASISYNITKDDLPIPPGLPISINLSQGFAYMNLTAGSYTQVGLGGKINIPMLGSTYYPTYSVYDTVDVLYKFPLNYNNVDSANAYYLFSLNAGIYSANIYEHKKRVNTVDGWGQVTTPLGTFECLRIKSYSEIHDSISVAGFLDSAIERSTTEYIWLTKQHHNPVIKITESVAMGSSTYKVQYIDVDRYVGINENENTTGISLYPNPSKNFTNFSFTLKDHSSVIIEVVNILGSRTDEIYNGTMQAGPHHVTLNTADYSPGVYFVKMNVNDDIITRKLVVR